MPELLQCEEINIHLQVSFLNSMKLVTSIVFQVKLREDEFNGLIGNIASGFLRDKVGGNTGDLLGGFASKFFDDGGGSGGGGTRF